jgi:ElaB/YqjD/DUF883 family membrane-anchored ribosome-binding protein
MTNEIQVFPTDIRQLAEEAQAFMTSTSEAAGDNMVEANKSLAVSLDRVRGEAIERAKAANARLRKQAYGATAIGVGIGALFGFLASRNFAVRQR